MVNHAEHELKQVNFPAVWAPTSANDGQMWDPQGERS
jgi:hypothetical protein